MSFVFVKKSCFVIPLYNKDVVIVCLFSIWMETLPLEA